MNTRKNIKGLTLIETLVVIGVISVLLAIGGAMASRFASMQSIDNISHKISSTLNLVKLQSSRQGVQFQAVLSYDSSENILTIETQRGDSNRNSNNFTSLTTEQIRVLDNYEILRNNTVLTETEIRFNPNNTAGGAGSIVIRPTIDANINKCGTIVVTPFGRVRSIIGNWDPEQQQCSAIYDRQQQPGS